jgi:predicted acylesterase/phospholipase RssA
MELTKAAAGRGPRGLLLLGGGALGAWQAGLVAAWDRAGVKFDRVLGISIGALNGVAYAMGLVDKMTEYWHSFESRPVLKVSPRDWLRGGMFSDRPMREFLSVLSDEKELARRARCAFYSVSCSAEDRKPLLASYEPGGRWDGALIEHLVAGCSLPWVFPGVRMTVDGRERKLVDGGYARCNSDAMKPLEGCGELVIVGMVPPREIQVNPAGAWDRVNRIVKRALFSQARNALLTARNWPKAPEIVSVFPSAPLRQFVLDFSDSKSREGFRAGLEDGSAFLPALDLAEVALVQGRGEPEEVVHHGPASLAPQVQQLEP